MVHKLFVQSDLSNCKFDCDKVLLDILSLPSSEKKQKATKQPEKCPVKDILKVANPQMCIPLKNGLYFRISLKKVSY